MIDNDKITVLALNNKWLPWKQFLEDVSNFKKIAKDINIDIKNVDVKSFIQKAKKELKNWKISSKQYKNLISAMIPVITLWIFFSETD
jgi:hypothetical protein